MTPNADDLAKNLAALTERFAGLAAKLIQAAQELQTSGTLPAEALLEELAAARGAFIDLRSSVLDAARARALTAPPQAEVGSLKALEPVLQAVAAAGATQVQVQRTTLVEARRRVLAVLDRVMTINHVDDPNFAVLLEAQAKAREIRAAVLDPKGPTAEIAAAIMQSTPVFSALLTLIDGRDRLDAEKCAVLEDSVTRLFGPAPPRARPAAPPKGFEGTVQPAATAPTQRFAPPASSPASPFTPPPAPAPAMQEVAAAPPAPQDAGAAETVDTAVLDDGAQWWVSAWARWTSAKGTIDFNAAVKQELSKYAYLLSVPIQQAADYEEGLLAYGYSILLDFLERKSPGIVTRALNSLKTFAPDTPGHAQSAGAHLYNFLLGEGRLVEQYPEFVRSVLAAAAPEPGLWTQASILESTTETRVFTHPSARVGEPDHNSQRLTQDRQRFADHRFAVTLPSLTARFFAVAADLSEPRGIDVKLMEGRADSEDAWLLTIPPVDRVDLKSEPIRLAREGTSVPGLGKDYAALWVGVFNAQPEAAKNYELTLSLRKDARSSARRSAKA